ncbi:acyl-CoA dehydrogenase family protein [Kineococcus arenarius]|uniref:acyl-CoA dehydrogenase family protein n=1 Tax=unclassified Kineococcus TaxID=2621656 RepID=UPI003D7ED5A2
MAMPEQAPVGSEGPPPVDEPAPLYPVSDPFGYERALTAAERGKLHRLRSYLDAEVRPLLAEHWEQARCPVHVRTDLADLRLHDDPALLAGGSAPRPLYLGFRSFELARTDLSVAMLYSGQVGMFRTLVLEGGSPEQIERWDDDIVGFRMTGAFALTEPGHGSDVARGMETTAERRGTSWRLDGRKRWIGNATVSGHVVVVARNASDGGVAAFVVPTSAPGLSMRTIERKTSLRMVHNADITLAGVHVDDTLRLPRITTFADVNRAFGTLRADVVWLAAGLQAGAYEAALRYAGEREQFGRPIAGFQLVQDKLVRMLGNVVASLGVAVRLSEVVDEDPAATSTGSASSAASLAKLWTADRLRETVALARETVGGEGITLDTDVSRFFADAEALYTYEGTREVNTLIVGRAITGLSAFTR